ncbi:MAG TPA: hypothetical protein VK993_10825 [Chthoniobacterales bacterium]|nr:hypothetical protein [Chthoniobacterales bacterium]
METNVLRCALGALMLLGTAAVQADPVSELASFSAFDKVDLGQLAGEAKPIRGAPMSTTRFLSVQTAWVAPGSPPSVAEAMRRWSPTNHPELKVYMHSNGSNFARLAEAPDNSAVQALVSATLSKSPDLQISKEEAAKLPASGNGMAGPVASFWSGVLSARASAGPFSQPSYDHAGEPIKPGDEINALLRQQPKIQKQFSGLISGSGDKFWELIGVSQKGVLTLGASYNREASAGSYQAADVLYYASGGYYVAITLYQMWPVEVDGRASTLVWRGDMTSSAELANLTGVERMGSESAMIRDISRAVRLFRRDTGAAR